MQDTWVESLGGEDPLEEEMATHSSILVWEIPWTEEPGGLQSIGSQKSRTLLNNTRGKTSPTQPPPPFPVATKWTSIGEGGIPKRWITDWPEGEIALARSGLAFPLES